MKDKVIFKLFRNQIFENEYRNLMVSVYPVIFNDLKGFVESNGKSFYFMLLSGELVDGTPMLEIEYTGTLTENEKNYFLECVKKLSSEGEVFFSKNGCVIKEESTLCLVKFKQITKNEEIVEVKKQKLNNLAEKPTFLK